LSFEQEETDALRQGLDNFIKMIHGDHFADAHETLEYSWKALRREYPDEAKILKGLINGATALELKRRDRNDAAQRVWKTFEKYKPLIAVSDSTFTENYTACTKILEKKHKELFKPLLLKTENI